MKITLFLILLLLASGELRAEAVKMAIGEMHLLEDNKVVTVEPKYAVESGREVRLEIPIDAPQGSKVSLQPEFFQLANDLSAPVALPLDFKTPQPDFKDATHQVVTVSLVAFEVKKITRFLIRFTLHDEAAKKDSRSSSAILLVYPKELPGVIAKAIAQKLSESQMRLVVFGESPAIRTFLQSHHVDFDSHDDWPADFKSDTLYIGQTTAKQMAEHLHPPGHAHILIFMDSETESLPGIYRTEAADATVTKVTLPLLDTLGTNPHSRQIFTDLIYQNLTRENP